MKFAVVDVFLPITMLQVRDVVVQAPVHPVNVSPAAGVAVSVTVVPCMNLAEQLLPQLIAVEKTPFGVPVTLPLPPRPTESV